MNAEFEHVVRDSMSQFTEDVTLPAGLADRARRRVRRRQRARMGGLAATVVAIVTAVLVITAAGQARPTQPSASRTHPSASRTRPNAGQTHPNAGQTHPNAGQAFPARLTAEVIRHVVTALTKTAATNPVEYYRAAWTGMRALEDVMPGRDITPADEAYIGSSAVWYRGQVVRDNAYSPAGQLILGQRTVHTARTVSVVSINYPHRIWWRTTYPAEGQPPTAPATKCVLDLFGTNPYWTTAEWASQLRKLVKCGNVQVQGRQRVDGVDAIKIETHVKKVRRCGVILVDDGHKRLRKCAWGITGAPGTLLINPSTYLPIRWVDDTSRITYQADFAFLPPTRANLAKLGMTIPPGFKGV